VCVCVCMCVCDVIMDIVNLGLEYELFEGINE